MKFIFPSHPKNVDWEFADDRDGVSEQRRWTADPVSMSLRAQYDIAIRQGYRLWGCWSGCADSSHIPTLSLGLFSVPSTVWLAGHSGLSLSHG